MNQPNIIFIFSDQQRYNTMGCTGNSEVRTPAFDRLAAEGVLFRQAFSSCPICSPYRAQVLTGLYSHKNGVLDNEYKLYDNQATFAQALKAAGYQTGYIGKWHLGYGPYTPEKRYGFDYMGAYNCNHEYYDVAYWENETGPIPIEGWAPVGETDLAIRFMQNHREKRKDAPFFLMLSWGPPHWPYEKYPKEHRLYDPDAVDVPQNVPEQMNAFAQNEIAHYYGNITGLDAQMGRLMDWLDVNGLREDTILCFSSDHGDHLSSHNYGKPMDRWLHPSKRASKATPHEESIHIPFILSYPGRVNTGKSTDILFNSVDVMPTLLSLAGVDIPQVVQGQDLSHVATGGIGPEPDSVYLQILGPGWPHRGDWVGCWRGLRTDRWVYARWYGSSDTWLFDRENDPYEMKNLADNPEYAPTRKQMEQRLGQWIEDTADPFETGDRDPKTGMLCLGQEYTHRKYKARS
jgi:arylsulfatase A-like enzyme